MIKLERPYNYTQQEIAVHFEEQSFSGVDVNHLDYATIIDGISCLETFSIGTEKAEEVAQLLREGLTQKEIALKLNISQPEVSRRKQQRQQWVAVTIYNYTSP